MKESQQPMFPKPKPEQMVCVRCKRPRGVLPPDKRGIAAGEPFFALFCFLQSMGVKPRTKSRTVKMPLCPECAVQLPEAVLLQLKEPLDTGNASSKK